MLHILFLILKIILIIVTVLLGIVLLLLLIPYSYSIEGDFNKSKKVKFNIKWFARIIYFRFIYLDGDMTYRLKVLGISVIKGILGGEESEDESELLKDELVAKFEQDESSKEIKNNKLNEKKAGRTSSSQFTKKTRKKKKRRTFLQFVTSGIKNFYKKIKKQISKICATIKKILKQISEIIEFLESEETKEAFKYTKEKLLKIISHIKPKKVEADVIFGFDSPDKTGQTLGYLAMIFGMFNINPDKVRIIPNFEKKVFKGKFLIKGRFVLIYILVLALKVYFKKEVQNILGKFK